jgi:hypothetical protein
VVVVVMVVMVLVVPIEIVPNHHASHHRRPMAKTHWRIGAIQSKN